MRIFIVICCLLQFIFASAQNYLPTPRNIKKTYENGTRSVDGKPGKNYWQNNADYNLSINFFPATRLLSGVADITYFNKSPDTLNQIWFNLTPNYYKKGSIRSKPISEADVSDGIIIDQFSINGKNIDVSKFSNSGTNMEVAVQALSPGEQIHFVINYHYTLNKGSHNRTGEVEPGAAFVAYFFPRIAVYDDIDGWNKFPYDGGVEFYNDFCHFKASITVPSGFVVWATGDLKNGNEVLTPSVYHRLLEAEKNDAIIHVIDTTDIINGDITPSNKLSNTWKFEADNVTDFVFATSDHYVWQSSSLIVDPISKRRTRVDAVFDPKHKDYFKVAAYARKTVEAMSYTFPAWPFPYTHETVFDGLDQMEYPMMVNDNPLVSEEETIELTVHEIFHTIFPFYMGINEIKYAWMDEGWATIGEWLISPIIDSSIIDEYGVGPTADNAGNETDPPVMTLSNEQDVAYFTNSYPKPAMGYLYIKDYLGDVLFTKALHHYITQWNGKHPMPNDFFYSMNEGAGKNMNWFWEKWFFDDGIPDLAIKTVKKKSKEILVTIENKGGKPVPVDLTVFYTDGTKEHLHKTIAIWEKGNKTATIRLKTKGIPHKLELYNPHIPDSNPADNIYLWE